MCERETRERERNTHIYIYIYTRGREESEESKNIYTYFSMMITLARRPIEQNLNLKS